MFRDARKIPPDTTLQCDLAIVGAGAAGIVVASELADSKLRVLLIESGGFRHERETQRLAVGDVDDKMHSPLDRNRRRIFGGTTSVWGGRCSPFDSIDFAKRAHIPHSGWPLTVHDLVPYYERAQVYTETGEFNYDAASAIISSTPRVVPEMPSSAVLDDRIWRFSPPTHFGARARNRLAASTVDVLLHANVVNLVAGPSGAAVDSLRVKTLSQQSFSVRPRAVVLAAGGCIQSTRLLLLASENSEATRRLTILSTALGAFYISHLSGEVGEVAFASRVASRVAWNYERTRDGVYCKRTLRITEKAQLEHNLSNVRFPDLTLRPFRGSRPPERRPFSGIPRQEAGSGPDFAGAQQGDG